MDTFEASYFLPVVILAAGAARRFGRAKQLEHWPQPDSPTLVERTVKLATQARLGPVYVVTGNRSEEVAQLLADQEWPTPVRAVYNPRWKEGQGYSVAAGVERVQADWPAAPGILFMLADQPRLSGTTLERISSYFVSLGQQAASLIIFPTYNGRRGNPVIFGRAYFEELTALEGDTGGRAVVRTHPAAARELPVNDPAIHEDVDTLADLKALPLTEPPLN